MNWSSVKFSKMLKQLKWRKFLLSKHHLQSLRMLQTMEHIVIGVGVAVFLRDAVMNLPCNFAMQMETNVKAVVEANGVGIQQRLAQGTYTGWGLPAIDACDGSAFHESPLTISKACDRKGNPIF